MADVDGRLRNEIDYDSEPSERPRLPPVGSPDCSHCAPTRLTVARHLVARISWAERLGPGSVEDHSRSVSGISRVAGRGCSSPSLYGRQIWLSSPRWEGATPIHNPLRCPPCHSRPMPIAVTTFRSSRIG